MSEHIRDALQRFGIPADESEVAILTAGYADVQPVVARLHAVPVGITPPASLLNPAPTADPRDHPTALEA